jgi:hypothetical protein
MEPNGSIPDIFGQYRTLPEVQISRNNPFETTDCDRPNFNQETTPTDY